MARMAPEMPWAQPIFVDGFSGHSQRQSYPRHYIYYLSPIWHTHPIRSIFDELEYSEYYLSSSVHERSVHQHHFLFCIISHLKGYKLVWDVGFSLNFDMSTPNQQLSEGLTQGQIKI